jgi:hypothetical protein
MQEKRIELKDGYIETNEKNERLFVGNEANNILIQSIKNKNYTPKIKVYACGCKKEYKNKKELSGGICAGCQKENRIIK